MTTFLPLLVQLLGDERPDVPAAALILLTEVNDVGIFEALGPGLVTRYVIPQLLDRIGIIDPQDLEDDGDLPVVNQWNMFEVRALTTLCLQIDDDIVGRLVADRLLNETLPALEPLLLPEPPERVCIALLEILSALEGFIPILSPAAVTLHYCQQQSISLQQLLLTLPLPSPPGIACTPIFGYTALRCTINRLNVHTRLCHLLAQVCSCVGAEATQEMIIPFLDSFFGYFTDTYHVLDELEVDCAEYPAKCAALEMVEELWREMKAIFNEGELRTFLPNAMKIVAPWYDEMKAGAVKEADRWGRHSSGNRDRERRNSGAGSQSGGGGVTDGEKPAWQDLGHHLEKGLAWFAKRHRTSTRDGTMGGPITPSTSLDRPQGYLQWQNRLSSDDTHEYERMNAEVSL